MILFSKQSQRKEPMETFAKLFGSLLALVYHCFDRIVILGHLPLSTDIRNVPILTTLEVSPFLSK
jgi:hypothetical protein